jgi:hypothetical protein
MTPTDKELLSGFNGNPPADAESIRRIRAESGVQLPGEYVEFLRQVNGGEGFIGPNAYVILWRLEELRKYNDDYQVGEYAPGLFLFGSDGGGEAFALDTRSEAMPIVSVPFVGMDLDSARVLAAGFREFLRTLFES